jgi:hypothetical protein
MHASPLEAKTRPVTGQGEVSVRVEDADGVARVGRPGADGAFRALRDLEERNDEKHEPGKRGHSEENAADAAGSSYDQRTRREIQARADEC